MCGNYARTTCHVSLIVICMQYDARPKEANVNKGYHTSIGWDINFLYVISDYYFVGCC